VGEGVRKCRQYDEKQTDSINTQVVIDRRLVDPLMVFLDRRIPGAPTGTADIKSENRNQTRNDQPRLFRMHCCVIVAASQSSSARAPRQGRRISKETKSARA